VQNIHDELKIMQRIKNLTSAYPLSATPATRGGFPGVFPGFSRLPQRHFQYLNFDIFCIWRGHEQEGSVSRDMDNIASMQIGQK